MDLVAEEQRDIIFKEREEDLKRLSLPLNCTAFKTSIWDETLYKAWSNIVSTILIAHRDLNKIDRNNLTDFQSLY